MTGGSELRRWGGIGAWLLALATSTTALAAPPVFRPTANPDLLRLGSLPFDTAEGAEVEPGQWQVTTSLSYANLWNFTWHTVAYHREVGRTGLCLSSAELAGLAARYPNQWYQFLDVEGWWGEVWVQRGLGNGVTATVRVPYIQVGAPHWDSVAERWHRWLGFPDFHRPEFPRGEALVYIKGPGGTVERRDVARSGLGDVSLALAIPAGQWLGGTHRAVAAVEAPVGKAGTLQGSGGWDGGARLLSRWGDDRFSFVTGLGYTWTSSHGSLLGLRRNHAWHTLAGFDWRIWGPLIASTRLQVERSLLAQVAGDRLSKATLSKRFGVAVPLPWESWLAFDLGQDSRHNGVTSDFSFHLAVGHRLP